MRSTALLPLLLLAAPLTACQYAEPSHLYDVSATLSDTTCGTGALDAADSISFQVSLQREDDTLTWYDVEGGAEMQALIADDEVTVSTSQDFTVTESTQDAAGCTLRRRDVYDATLTGSGNNIDRADGDITFNYSQVSGYDCDAIVGVSDGIDELPCNLEYTFVALPAE